MIPIDTPVGTEVRLVFRWAEKHDTVMGRDHGMPSHPAGSGAVITRPYSEEHEGYGYYPLAEQPIPPGGTKPGHFGVRLDGFVYQSETDHHSAHPGSLELEMVTDEQVRAAFGRTFRFDAEEAT